jgi:SAM-dependent methyltransferase
MMDKLWLKPEIADAQQALVLRELQDPIKAMPFRYFLEAMRHIDIRAGCLLDVGCGVGHYGLLCEKNFPQFEYHGTDVSPAMIERARDLAPLGQFRVCDFKSNDFGDYDIVLIGQVMELADDPWELLDYALLHTHGYLILHRLRLTEHYSRKIPEKAYGIDTFDYEWNKKIFERHLSEHVTLPWIDLYQYTIIIPPA